MDGEMKKLFVVSWSMPPLLQPRSLQVSRTLRELKKHGWLSSVICVDSASLPQSFHRDAELLRTSQNDFELIPISSPGQFILYRAATRLFPFLNSFPDQEWLWVKNALAMAQRRLAAEKYSALISFAQPWSSHVLAWQLKIKTQLPWAAHFSDPWRESPYRKRSLMAVQYAKKMEERVIREADRLIFVNSYTRDVTLKNYSPEIRNKAVVIPHGYEPQEENSLSPSHGRVVNILHVGQFYNQRMPWTFFKALSLLREKHGSDLPIRICFVGDATQEMRQRVKRLNLESLISFEGMVSHAQSLKMMGEADALLLIEASLSNLFFPSKLVDYISVRKPILGLVPSPGPSSEVLSRLQCPVVHPDDAPGIAAALGELMDRKLKGTLHISNDYAEGAKDYDIRVTTEKFRRLLEDLTG